MKKLLRFIVNPFSGVSDKQNLQSTIQPILDHKKFDFEIVSTKAPGHATDLAEKAIMDGVDIVVAVGGDGTINEVAKALLYSDAFLGILPGGSGNGFANHLGISRNLKQAIKVLNTGVAIPVDTCLANEAFFLNVAGVGFDALIAYNTRKNKARGFTSYFKSSVKSAWQYQNKTYSIHFDDQTIRTKCLSIEIANASYFGYQFAIAPQARLQDGVLDLVMIKDAPKFRYILSLPHFMTKSIHKSGLVKTAKLTRVTVECEEPMYFHIDGEGKLSKKAITFSIVPRSLKVIAPVTHQLI